MSDSSNRLKPDDINLHMAKDLKNQGYSNIKIRKELELIGLEEEYINAIIREINPSYQPSTFTGKSTEVSPKKTTWKSVWTFIIFIIIIIKVLMRLVRD